MGWFQDLEQALAVFQEHCPQVETFDSITCNMYGDFEIRAGFDTYIVTHVTLKVWKLIKDERRWEEM